jgi:hypothetical protein
VKPTTERLAEAMEAAGCDAWLLANARAGHYDDYKSDLACPIYRLVADLKKEGHEELAQRAMNGEFDGTREEADEWARSPEGQQVFRDLVEGL